MTMDRGGGGVVVGVDGSAAGRAAARWAALAAQRRGVTLRLVHVLTPSSEAGYPEPRLARPKVSETDRRRARRLLANEAHQLTEDHPGLLIETATREGTPGAVFVAESMQAILTVVGSHGAGQVVGVVFGSVAARLASHGHGCVVIVRRSVHQDAAAPSGPIVVGVDDSPQADVAIAFAFEEAATREAALIAIHVCNDQPLEHALGRYPLPLHLDAVEAAERRLLAEHLAPWAEKYPDVEIRTVILRGRASSALLHYRDAGVAPQLLIVGSRDRGGFARLLLGSTSMALVGHADCPVAVVRGE